VETLEVLREKMASKDVDKIVRILYNNLVEAKEEVRAKS
jgi:hypothetical protein